MIISLKKTSNSSAQTLVVFVAKDEQTKAPAISKLPDVLQKLINTANTDGVFTGDKKETVLYRNSQTMGASNVLLVGLGDNFNLGHEQIRVAASIAYQALKNSKSASGAFIMDSLFNVLDQPDLVTQAAAEGVLLTAYEYNELKSKSEKKKKSEKPQLKEVEFLANKINSNIEKALAKAEILAECQNFARRLGDTPGNLMTPSILAEETTKAAKGTGLKVTVWDKARIKKENFGGLLSVSLGSDQDPRFIIMEYNGGGKKKPVCFVGKGLTFDSGGISIKPSASMEEMKYDMCGGAGVIGAMLAIARLKLKVNVIGLVPSSENMPGPSALKPGDVYYARNGISVEVFNTDAEGRLILADALAYGSEQKPSVIFDAATLTGAILIGLGNTYTGVFTRNQPLMSKIQEAANATGELVWPMPLDDFHVEDMKGTHADLCNISSGRLAGSSTAAAFLEQFVDKDIPWAHFDIAGTAWNVNSRFPYCPKKSASGVIVRTFVELAEKA
jgi:leucyl aminopeptidase